MISLPEMKRRAGAIRQEYAAASSEVETQQCALRDHNEARRVAEEVAGVVSQAAQAAQMRFVCIVAGVVTECLNSVYPSNPYEFRMEFRECAGKTVVDTLLYRDGEPLDPLASTGGGVWNVLAFGLRVSIMILTARDDTRKLLVVDEPFSFLHGAEKVRKAYETMEAVGRQFGLTILCVRQHCAKRKIKRTPRKVRRLRLRRRRRPRDPGRPKDVPGGPQE